jgi:hypothetical protein
MIRPSPDDAETGGLMRTENIPIRNSTETPPLAPHDPPDPAPQAAAWRRALRVVGCAPPKEHRIGKTSVTRITFRKA